MTDHGDCRSKVMVTWQELCHCFVRAKVSLKGWAKSREQKLKAIRPSDCAVNGSRETGPSVAVGKVGWRKGDFQR